MSLHDALLAKAFGGGNGGGGADIDVTAAVGQTIRVTEVDENGKPTKWASADYQPRTHYLTETVMLPETTLELDEELGGYLFAPAFLPNVGETYAVIYNGAKYESVCEEIDGMCVFGNIPAAMGTGDNGIPFLAAIISDADGVFAAINPLDGAEAVTVAIKQLNYTPIPVQYVTNALPYYIEITGSGAVDNPYVCNDTVENVRAVYYSGRPLVVRNGSGAGGEGITAYLPLVIAVRTDALNMYRFSAQGINAASYYNIDLTEQEDGTFAISDGA